MLSQLFSWLGAFIVIAAVFLLWWKSRSPWLLVSLAGEVVGVVVRTVISLPGFDEMRMQIFGLLTLTYLAFAVGLLGYAVVENTKSAPPPGGSAP